MILIVDDDPSVTTSLELLLKRAGHVTRSAADAEGALAALAAESFELVLQDMNFSAETSGAEGLALLAEIRARHPRLPVVLITAWGSIGLAVEGMKAGAADFLTKPWSNEHLLRSIGTVLELAGRTPGEPGATPARAELDARFDFGNLVGEDPAFLATLALIGRVADTDASVLITGESGTGKELVAEAIHENSRRQGGAFVKVNLGGVSSTLFESEMFGHVRGAFTDARADRKGRFEVADGGTIFLDEIGELDPSSQVKLLRVLQDRSFEVLGSSATRRVDVRVVSATNRDLAREVERGAFREDLLYRLNLIALRLPALRERPSDIPRLAHHFLEQCGRSYSRPGVALTPRALRWLGEQAWPGNVRQLRQTIERAVLVTDSERIDAEMLAALAEPELVATRETELLRPGSLTLEELERVMIARSLRHYRGNVSRVAEALGISRAALYRRIEKYGLGSGGDEGA